MTAGASQEQETRLSNELIDEASSVRYAVRGEDSRVQDLFDERYIDPSVGASRLASLSRSLLERMGIYRPQEPVLVERPHLEDWQAERSANIARELEQTRRTIRNNIVMGADDVEVDDRIGLRTDDSMLSPFLQGLHRRAEERAGHKLSFLDWMVNLADDRQLLNVLQWHDNYLRQRDDDPAFRERIERVQAEYTAGLQGAVAAGELHPDLLAADDKQAIKIVHGSPFSPILSHGLASANKGNNKVEMREEASDLTLDHELTHLIVGGMTPLFNEAATERIAQVVHRHAYPDAPDEPLSYRYGLYTLDAIEDLTEGAVTTYQLSQCYAGPDAEQNTRAFVAKIDDAVGMPIGSALLEFAEESRQAVDKLGAEGILSYGMVQVAAADALRAVTDVWESGDGRTPTVPELMHRLTLPSAIEKYDVDTLNSAHRLLQKANRLQQGE